MNLGDRLTRGFAVGAAAGVPTLIVNILLNYCIKAMMYLVIAGTLVFGSEPKGLGEKLFAVLVVFFFMGLMGAVFACMIPKLSARNLLFKGWLFGTVVWFSSYAITILFKVPGLEHISLASALGNLAGASVWGLFLAYLLDWVDGKVKQEM